VDVEELKQAIDAYARQEKTVRRDHIERALDRILDEIIEEMTKPEEQTHC